MTDQEIAALQQRIAQLEAQMADLQARMPAHSVKPAMIQELDDLDDQLADARAQLVAGKKTDPPPDSPQEGQTLRGRPEPDQDLH